MTILSPVFRKLPGSAAGIIVASMLLHPMECLHAENGADPARENFRIIPEFIPLRDLFKLEFKVFDEHESAPVLLSVSRVEYAGNTFGSSESFPAIFNDPAISGIQGIIYIDKYLSVPYFPRLGAQKLTGITTSFSSKSEGALMRSPDGRFLTYMGYNGAVGSEGVSNSETPGATLTTNTAPTYDRVVALISQTGSVSLTNEANAYSGDNPRASITADGTQLYMAGNSDSSLNKDGTGPGTTIGARIGAPGSSVSTQLGSYTAPDRSDESTKQHIKDNNFRAIGIYGNNLYVSKGSGGNGDDGVFQVHKGTGNGLPIGTGNTITALFSAPATNPTSGALSPYTPFGFWFANEATLYVADEGYANTDSSGNIIIDPLAGLEKWSLNNGVWTMDYVIQNGLDLGVPENVKDYPAPTTTTGLRNMTGMIDADGIVTIFAITAQTSSISGGEPDPTKLVMVKDMVSARSLASGEEMLRLRQHGLDSFKVLQQSKSGEVFRGVALSVDGKQNQPICIPHGNN